MVLTVEPPPSTLAEEPIAPFTGNCHPHSPDSTPAASDKDRNSEDPDNGVPRVPSVPLNTKSPHTKRMIKRGCTKTTQHNDSEPTWAPQMPGSPTPFHLPNAGLLAEFNAPSTTPPSLVPHDDVAADQVQHLESLLDSVLATLVIIQSATSNTAINYTSPSDSAFVELCNHQAVVIHHANVVTLACLEHHASQILTASSYAGLTIPFHNPRSPWRASLIISSVTLACLTPIGVFKGLTAHKFAGANITNTGNIILYTKSPLIASSILPMLSQSDNCVIWSAARAIPGFTDPGPNAHLTDALEDSEGPMIWHELEDKGGLSGNNFRDLHFLCCDEEVQGKEHLSLRIMVDNPAIFTHLYQNGIFLFGTHCCVSQYHPHP
ncbi:hypothetical protein BJ912DRAFT_921839 [Pholiota molesta]|nr:hypothetical protein BJ912DRAFT_921839 [Pholiota molesta]